MAISLHQVQKLTQRLAMTPLMQQALHLLQLPTTELEELVLQEAAQNPFLEIEGEIDEDSSTDSGDAGVQTADTADGDAAAETVAEGETPAHFDEVDVEWDSVYDTSLPRSPSGTAAGDSEYEEGRDFEDYIPARETLRDNLLWQARLLPVDEHCRKIVEYIIDSLDEDGYLRVPLEEIASETGAELADVERALACVQSLEPAGIGARSLAECLEIQLRQRRVDDPLAYEIVRHHMADLQKRNVRKIAKDMGADEERVRQLVTLISSLEPSPGYAFSTEPPQYIRPDVIVKRIDDDYYVYVDDGRLAGLRISPMYRRLVEEGDKFTTDDERKFAREKLKAAQWLLKNLARRKNTLLRVAQAILEHQREFLDKGISHLKPLTLRQVADMVGMHESTIARVTSGKYIETPRGTFEMKFFFSRGLQSDSGEEASNTTVKQMIADMVAGEDPANPLSDQQIVQLLKEKGIHVARRTVAKYREQLGILPSRLRKKL